MGTAELEKAAGRLGTKRTEGGVVDLGVWSVSFHNSVSSSAVPLCEAPGIFCYLSLLYIIHHKKTCTFPFAARRTVVRHSALRFMPLPMLPFEIVHSGISKTVTSS